LFFFFFNDTATTEIYTLSLHDALPISNLLVQSTSAIRFVHGLRFKDIAHMTYSAPMDNYLAQLICSQLTSISSSTRCTPNLKAVK